MFMAMQQVGMLGVMSEVRDPLTEVAPHRQRSDSLAPDSAAIAKSSEKRRGLEKPHRERGRAPPKTGQAGYFVPSSSKELHRPDRAEALHSAPQQVCTRLGSSPTAAAIDRLMCIACTANADESDNSIVLSCSTHGLLSARDGGIVLFKRRATSQLSFMIPLGGFSGWHPLCFRLAVCHPCAMAITRPGNQL